MGNNVPETCQKCGLYKQGHNPEFPLPLPGDGDEHPDIIFLGEAIGYDEYKQGKPFVGKTGKHLRDTINASDVIPHHKVRFTNAVRCRPPENRTPTSKEIACCSQFLVDELEQCNAKVVVLLGNTPLKAVLGYNGITSFQGQLIERDDVKYVPCYHPSYVLRQNGNVDEDWLKTFMVIEDALKDGSDTKPRADAHYQYLYPMSIPELEQMRDELLSTDDLIACDIEAISKRISYPDNKIISMAFANSNKAWSFPIDHKDWAWNDEERTQIINIIRDILTKGKIINHLIKFDCKMIRHFLGIDFVPYGDTIQLSRLVSPQALEHGLKRLAGIHLGMFDYDEELNQYIADHPDCDYAKDGHYGNVPLEVLLPYGGMDVSATRMLHDVLYAQLTEKQRILYEQMIINADYALGLIEENGFKLDYWIIERYRNIYQIIMDKKYKPAMMLDKHLQQSIHARHLFEQLKKAGLLTQTKVGKKFVCEIGGVKFNKDEWHTFYLNHQKQLNELELPAAKQEEFNPGASQQVYPVIYQYKKLVPENKIARTDTGLPCIKRDILKKVVYDLGLNGKKDQFLLDYMDWKLLFSIVNKTFKPMTGTTGDWYGEDGRVHSSYTLGGAKTGRTSSSQPNVQNIPAIEKEHGTVLQYLPAKNAFTHTFDGGGLAMLDYSGMELRVMASIAGIQGMLDVFNRKGDVHRYVSSLIYKKPEDKITKDERYRGKWCNWSLLYLGDDHTLYRLYSHQGVTKEESVQITGLYFQSFPQLKQYHRRIEEFVMTNGYVESEFGRRLLLPAVHDSNDNVRREALRTAVNMPIQGLASDVLMIALAIIVKLIRNKNYKSMFVNTVHDSLVLDYHPDERDELVGLCKDVMENVVDYAAEFAPGLDFGWLKVPLKADVEYGVSYGAYGFYQPLLCENCGNEMVFLYDTRESSDEGIDYCVIACNCRNCGINAIRHVKALEYNNFNVEVLALRQRWQQVMLGDKYCQNRMPRKELYNGTLES